MTNKFAKYVAVTPPHDPRLPLTHTFKGKRLQSIMTSGQLIPINKCKVFNQVLLFYFYGKPAYRPSDGGGPNTDTNIFPVSIVLKHDSIIPIRIAPFDTGGFQYYHNHIPAGMEIEDFLLQPAMDMPSRLVNLFYGSNNNYYFDRPSIITVPTSEPQVQSYYNLICSKGKTKYDNRCSSIEIQTDQLLNLNSSNVLYIVLPKDLMEYDFVRSVIIDVWQCEYDPYPTYRCDPAEYMGIVYRSVGDYLKSRGYI